MKKGVFKMTSSDVREEFHKLIDTVQDDRMLKDFYDALNDARGQKRDILDDLSVDQRERLEQSLSQAARGTTISHEQIKSKIEEWRTK